MTRKTRIKRVRWSLLLLVLFAFAWRAHNLGDQSLWRDEVDAVYFASRNLPATLSMFVETAQNGALYFLGLRLWLSLMGSSEFVLRYLSLIFGVLSIPMLWQVGRKLAPENMLRERISPESRTLAGNRRATLRSPKWLARGGFSLVAVWLLTINPYHLWYSQEGKMYSLIIFLALLAAWCWLNGIESGGFKWWFGFLVTVSLAIYTHLLMILLIPLFLAWFVIAWPRCRHHWKGFLLALAALTLPYLPLLVWQWEFLTTKEIVTALEFVPLGEILRTVLHYQSNSFIIPRHIIYLVPIFGLALAGTLARNWSPTNDQDKTSAGLKHRQCLLMILAWLIAPVFCIYLLSLKQPVFLPRYVIWITPAFMLLLGLGAQSVWNHRDILSKSLALSLILYVVVYWSITGWQEKSQEIKTDLRSTVGFLSENRSLEELLIIQIPNLHVAYQYYSSDQDADPFAEGQKRLGWWAAGLSPDADLSDETARIQVNEQMRGLTFGATDIWVMLSETELADPSHLMLEWLDGEATLIDQVEFRGAQIRQYRLSMKRNLTMEIVAREHD